MAGRRCRRTARSPATTTRRSTRTRRIPPPPGCGRSSSTATRARTCSPQGGARPVRRDTMITGRHRRQGGLAAAAADGPRRRHVPDARPDRRRPPSIWPTTGPRRSADADRLAHAQARSAAGRGASAAAVLGRSAGDLPDHPDRDGDRQPGLSPTARSRCTGSGAVHATTAHVGTRQERAAVRRSTALARRGARRGARAILG